MQTIMTVKGYVLLLWLLLSPGTVFLLLYWNYVLTCLENYICTCVYIQITCFECSNTKQYGLSIQTLLLFTLTTRETRYYPVIGIVVHIKFLNES